MIAFNILYAGGAHSLCGRDPTLETGTQSLGLTIDDG